MLGYDLDTSQVSLSQVEFGF